MSNKQTTYDLDFELGTQATIVTVLVDKASASGSGGRRFESHGERLSKDGCLSWDLFRNGCS
ncbi:hypothetical protein DPMN_013013 [Dreissena polymorpha]|uniref:Uncharacterized protein n=1 Tax=Dreissena polymorpha TaxID=45954 RepID=A0A9D4N6V9_DREPO|nr:hypothetical protein DPMN_013013 [Dreissena polymorpha]